MRFVSSDKQNVTFRIGIAPDRLDTFVEYIDYLAKRWNLKTTHGETAIDEHAWQDVTFSVDPHEEVSGNLVSILETALLVCIQLAEM